ncbi:hypothetical protein FQZ97_892490 [compost metagenome]
MWIPSNFGIWSTTMTIPMPALNPTNTGSEMKLATNPSRRRPASTRIAPTSNASVAAAVRRAAGVPDETSASAAPARMAMVVVVLTLRGREVPNRA